MFNLEGKKAFISGASRGLGKQFANALAKAGADIAITSRTLESLDGTCNEIRAIGKKCIPLKKVFPNGGDFIWNLYQFY